MTFDEFCTEWMRLRTAALLGRVALDDDLVSQIATEFRAALRRVYPWAFDVSADLGAIESGWLHFNISRPENVIRDHPDVSPYEADLVFRALRESAPAAQPQGFERVREAVSNFLGIPQGRSAQLPRVEHGPEIAFNFSEFMIAMPNPPPRDGMHVVVLGADGMSVTFTALGEGRMRVARRGIEIVVSSSDRGVMVRNNTLWPESGGSIFAKPQDPALAALGF